MLLAESEIPNPIIKNYDRHLMRATPIKERW